MKAVIVDDDPNSLDLLEDLLNGTKDVEVKARCDRSTMAMKCISEHRPDIIFLDINMPEKNGIELAQEIRDLNLESFIVFITAYDQHAIEAFKVSAFDYLLKPIDPKSLNQTISRISEKREKTNLAEKIDKLSRHLTPEKIRFNTRTGFILVDPNEIVYCEADGNYTIISLSTGKTECVTFQLGKIEKNLDENSFIRINRSIIINKNYINKFNRSKRMIKLFVKENFFEFKVSRNIFNES